MLHLNTSHVNVNLMEKELRERIDTNLNTSHVNVNLKR